MSVYAQGTAIIKTSVQTIEIKHDDLDWETEVEDADRPMGAELCHTGTYYFDEGEISWMVYEYPLGTINTSNIDAEGCHLLQNFSAFYLDDPTDGTEDNSDPDNYFRNNP